jgi:hypothetical protein
VPLLGMGPSPRRILYCSRSLGLTYIRRLDPWPMRPLGRRDFAREEEEKTLYFNDAAGRSRPCVRKAN